MEYNTSRDHLMIREYGRHVQNLIAYAKQIEDKEQRQEMVEGIIQLMGLLNPHLKNVADYRHKLWDHLFLIGGFDLDVDSPYERPSPEIAIPQPGHVPYPSNKIKYKHYGKNLESMITKAREYADMEKRNGLTEVIVNFMKMAYKNWSNDEVSDETIATDLKALSKGTLNIEEEMNMEAFIKSAATIPPQTKKSSGKQGGGQKNNRGNFNNKRRNPNFKKKNR